jgi:hypothetical protein
MNKKGLVFSLFISIILLIASGFLLYYWWTSSEPAKCSTTAIATITNSSLFLLGVMFLILGIFTLYQTFRPVTGCWGEGINQSAEVTGVNQNIKISNIKGDVKASNVRRKNK